MDRRSLLKAGAFGAAGLAASQWVAGCTAPTVPADQVVLPAPVDEFWDCGVLSGLHDHTSSVLWTRVAPGAAAAVDVRWEVASDPSFGTVVASGSGTASPDTDGTVKVLAQGLAPGSTYFYRFLADGRTSRTGRTRTPHAPGTSPERLRLAVASCQEWASGFWPAWRGIAAEDVDAVLHLGDYIYESGAYTPLTDVRRDPVGTAKDLAGYRLKYRLYRTDPSILDAHARHALVPIWDDHEFTNDYDRTFLVDQPERAAAAYRAWFEYQPVWPVDGTRTYRRLRWGQLADLTLLDTRQYRDDHPAGGQISILLTTGEPGSAVTVADRTLMGRAQRDWMFDGLRTAQSDGVRWKLVGNQVMLSPIRVLDLDEPATRALAPTLPKHAGIYFNADAWDGYQAERDLVTNFLADERVADVAFLTGDIHSFWQSDVVRDYDEDNSPVVAQEYVCGSISSRAADYLGPLADGLPSVLEGLRPGFRYADLQRRGYGVLECTAEGMQMQFRHADALYADAPVVDGASFTAVRGRPGASLRPG